MPRIQSRISVTAALAVLFGLTLPVLLRAQPAPIGAPVPSWTPNGAVNALVLDGHKLYAGGTFDQVGPRTGAFAVVDPADATALTTTAAIDQLIRQVIPDGAGGWYVLTEASFGGTTPGLILHLLSTGARDPGWTPPTFDSANIWTIAADGGRVFAGGFFQAVNGLARRSLVALDGATGAVLPWNPRLVVSTSSASPSVSTLAAIQGRLYASGFFDEAGGAVRHRFAILDTTTGDALPGTLTGAELPINEIRLTQTRVYLQGNCHAGASVICAYAADLTPLAGWTFPPTIGPIAVGSTAVYTSEPAPGGPPYGSQIVALDLDTGARLPWTPPVLRGESASSPSVLEVSGATLYIGGGFSLVNGQPRFRVAAVSATTGALLPWAPLIGGEVRSLAATAGGLAVGGRFASVGGIAKRNLVAIDLRTGLPTGAPPDLGFSVKALLKLGDVMVVGGERPFGGVGADLTAFLTTTGALFPWALESNGSVDALAADDRHLYIGGRFSSISGRLRLNLAAVELATAALTSWSPSPNAAVFTLATNGGTLFAAGAFNAFPGYGRSGAAAFDTASGALLSFNPLLSSAYGVHGFGFHEARVMLAGEHAKLPNSAGPFDWVERVTGSLTTPVSTERLRATATTQLGQWIYAVGISPSGEGQVAIMDAPSGRVRVARIRVAHLAKSVAANGDYVAIGGGLSTIASTTELSLAVYRAPRAGAPQRMTATVVASTVTLGWQPGPDIPSTAFLVEAGTAAGATDVGVFNVGPATQATGVLPTGTYFTRVRGIGANGVGAASSEVIITVPATAAAPGKPGTLSAAVAAGIVTLTWGAAPGNATTYVIEAGTVSGVMNIGAVPTGHLDTTWSIGAPAGTYFVRVRAANAFGLSTPTNEVTVVVP